MYTENDQWSMGSSTSIPSAELVLSKPDTDNKPWWAKIRRWILLLRYDQHTLAAREIVEKKRAERSATPTKVNAKFIELRNTLNSRINEGKTAFRIKVGPETALNRKASKMLYKYCKRIGLRNVVRFRESGDHEFRCDRDTPWEEENEYACLYVQAQI